MPSLITVITVCRNSEKTIAGCVKSILPILGEDVEYLIKDGASTDKTQDIIHSLCDGNPSIHVFSGKDSGIYDAMNQALNQANGEYLWFINSDDAIIPEHFPKILNALKSNPTIDCLYSDCEVLQRDANGIESLIKIWYGDSDISALKRGMICSHQAILCRRSLVLGNGGFNTRLKIAADWDLLLRLYNNHACFQYLPCAMAKFSRGGLSCTKRHIYERHLVRKWNHCYEGFVDHEWVRDLKTICHDFLLG